MLKTFVGASEDAASVAWLRAETCQSIFTDFKRVREAARQKIPFGIAQVGKAFRNEINPRNFTFRSREFEQAELEFFVHPSERQRWFDYWLAERVRFHRELGFGEDRLRVRPHEPQELAHYAKAAADIEFRFPFGWQEIEGVHDRGDWDLSRHSEFAGRDLSVTDEESGERFVPMVIETSVGVDRTGPRAALQRLPQRRRSRTARRARCSASTRRWRRSRWPCCRSRRSSPSRRAASSPTCAASGTPSTTTPATSAGATAGRTRSALPCCVTYDFESEQDGKVTVRDRDTMRQDRIAIGAVPAYLRERLEVQA